MRPLALTALWSFASLILTPAFCEAQSKRVFIPEDAPKTVPANPYEPVIVPQVEPRKAYVAPFDIPRYTVVNNQYVPVAQVENAFNQHVYKPVQSLPEAAPAMAVPAVTPGVRVYIPYSTFNPEYYPWVYRIHHYPRFPMTWPW